jgi:carbon storage regulator
MLVLTRKENESITIGDNVEIKVIAVVGNHVKLGIVAPREVRVIRSELLPLMSKHHSEPEADNYNPGRIGIAKCYTWAIKTSERKHN